MKEKQYAKTLAAVNAAALAAVILINALANALPINGITTGELSDMYPNLFVPAGITFSIWGLIYLLLIIWNAYQFREAYSSSAGDGKRVIDAGPWFLVSCIGNILWILFWHYQFLLLSLAVMLGILYSLIRLYLSIGIGTTPAGRKEMWLYRVPVSVYLGWISVATIANVTAVLVHYGWNGFGLTEAFWTAAVIIAGMVIAAGMIIRKQDVIHPLVVVWAYIGIIIKRSTVDAVPVMSVIVTAWIGVIAILALAAVFLFLGKNYLSADRN